MHNFRCSITDQYYRLLVKPFFSINPEPPSVSPVTHIKKVGRKSPFKHVSEPLMKKRPPMFHRL